MHTGMLFQMKRVNDIFYSLQGEGRNTGRAAIFIRFAGCNLKCPFCDTEFEMEALQGYDEELNNEPEENMSWDTAAGGEWQEGEQLYIQKEREWLVLRRRC